MWCDGVAQCAGNDRSPSPTVIRMPPRTRARTAVARQASKKKVHSISSDSESDLPFKPAKTRKIQPKLGEEELLGPQAQVYTP